MIVQCFDKLQLAVWHILALLGRFRDSHLYFGESVSDVVRAGNLQVNGDTVKFARRSAHRLSWAGSMFCVISDHK